MRELQEVTTEVFHEGQRAYDEGYSLGSKYVIWAPGVNVDHTIQSLVWDGPGSYPTQEHQRGFKDGYLGVPTRKVYSMPTPQRKKSFPSKNTGKAKPTRKPTPMKTQYINQVVFSGTLGKEPIANYTSNGKGYIKSSMALFLPGANEDDNTLWLDLVYWLSPDEDFEDSDVACRFNDMSKGEKVVIKGRLTRREYEGTYYFGVTVEDIKPNKPEKPSKPTKPTKPTKPPIEEEEEVDEEEGDEEEGEEHPWSSSDNQPW